MKKKIEQKKCLYIDGNSVTKVIEELEKYKHYDKARVNIEDEYGEIIINYYRYESDEEEVKRETREFKQKQKEKIIKQKQEQKEIELYLTLKQKYERNN